MASEAEVNGLLDASANGQISRFQAPDGGSHDEDVGSADDDRRPSSAPGRRDAPASITSRDDLGAERPKRPVKPMLQRSKSEYGPRQVEEPETPDEEIPEWGLRHGFEDHQSEQIIEHLASVS